MIEQVHNELAEPPQNSPFGNSAPHDFNTSRPTIDERLAHQFPSLRGFTQDLVPQKRLASTARTTDMTAWWKERHALQEGAQLLGIFERLKHR
eukprot:scaffold1262_cov134-Pinguiococcus_pyrenoidosus.AAC.1